MPTILSWKKIGLRFVIALMIVFVTYNPSGLSYLHWLLSLDSGFLVFKIFVGIALAVGWVIYIDATRSYLGKIGIALTISFFASLLWLLSSWGILPSGSFSAIAVMVLLMIAAVLTTGMCWPHIRRHISGLLDEDERKQP